MQAPSVHHAIFVADRTVPFRPERVFHALVDPASRSRWLAAPGGWTKAEHEGDVRAGGLERVVLAAPDGTTHAHVLAHADVLADRRLAFTTTRSVDGRAASLSVATIVVEPLGQGTRIVHTEQAVFLDGLDDVMTRKRHATEALAALQAELEASEGVG